LVAVALAALLGWLAVHAHDLARSEGWDAVTMRRLAERIEYSADFAYRYFTGRDDILLALVQDGCHGLRGRVGGWAPGCRRSMTAWSRA
jgi:AcrR family transcriptional regulator